MDDTEKIQELLTAAETSRASGDFETAYDNYRAAARKGSGEAAYRLGEFYENGIHVKRNVKAAKQWYFTAAIKGNAKANTKLENISNHQQATVATDSIDKDVSAFDNHESKPNITIKPSLVLKKTPPKKKPLFLTPVALAVILLIVIAVFLVGNKNDQQYAEKQLAEYYRLVNDCEALTVQNTDESLLNAKDKLREIKRMENLYSGIMPSEYNKSKSFVRLEFSLKHKCIEWTKAALVFVNDRELLIGYLNMASRFYENNHIVEALKLAENQTSSVSEIEDLIQKGISQLQNN